MNLGAPLAEQQMQGNEGESMNKSPQDERLVISCAHCSGVRNVPTLDISFVH